MAPPTVDLAACLDRLWVISDTHFGHDNVIQYTSRPFRADEQNEAMFQRWRETVGTSDPILHLGDVVVGAGVGSDVWEEIARLPGNPRWLVLGNHDREHRLPGIAAAGFVVIPPPIFVYRSWQVACTHEPMPTEDIARLGGGRALNVHGHVHDKLWLAPDPRHVNVCVERTDYRPVRLRPILDERLRRLEPAGD
jgi:calcineurin-like phosphoesterase family protein